MHMHTRTWYTCIEIANGHQHGGIHVYHVYMFNMHVHACVCVCAYMCMHACMCDTPSHTHTHPHPHPPICHPPQGGGPPESLKIQ